uniref:Reverse transcriptase/retrotransposon-derived protein RNase H-like domain-containing protein n=1 Tax=Tanacetum cinerariifolium TaxID=118510 RepID=A0A6L2M9U5_TANCI|nr:hypothetical protein [Tanacetum cinerariifolium]
MSLHGKRRNCDGQKVSEAGLEVNKAKINVISKLPPPLILKLLEKDTSFEFNGECHNAFKLLKEKLPCAPVIVSLNWNLPFKLMCDASDFAVGEILDSLEDITSSKGTKFKCLQWPKSKIEEKKGPKLKSPKHASELRKLCCRSFSYHNVLANEQQHTDQSEPIYDTYLLEKVDRNTSPGLTNMSHMGGEIDQDAEHDQVKSPLLKDEFLKMKDMVEKEVYNELSNRFLQLEKYCFSLEISIQQKEESFQTNKPCKNQDSPEFLKFFKINELKAQLQAKKSTINNLKKQIKHVHVKSNEAKDKYDIDVLETINIELESSVAKLLTENEKLNKENEHLKQTYKELFDLRIHTKDHNDSLIAQVNSKTVENADLKADLGKVTPYYVPKVRESVFIKPHHVIASGSSRNSSNKSFGSNDMAHKYYLEVAKKKTQEKYTSLKPSVRHTTSLQNTTNGSKPKPRSNNQTSRSFPIPKSSCGMSNGVLLVAHSRNSSSFLDSKHFIFSTSQKCVYNANHDDCITKFLKKVNSRAKVQSLKTRNINKPIEPKSHTQKPNRQISIGQRFSHNKSSAMREKPNTPRSCLRWIPTGRIFKTAGLKWIPTGSMFTDNTTKC